jgi:hypothetical protein
MQSDYNEFKKIFRAIMQLIVLVFISFTVLKEGWGTFGTIVGVIASVFYVFNEYNNNESN